MNTQTTQTTAHTPGPWYLRQDHPAVKASRENGHDVFPEAPSAWHWKITRIATPAGDFVVTGENDTASRREANARLIAAAPELLEAAKAIDAKALEVMASMANDAQCSLARALVTPLVELRKAIHKATEGRA